MPLTDHVYSLQNGMVTGLVLHERTLSVEKTKQDRAMVSMQTLVTSIKALENHNIKPTFAWPPLQNWYCSFQREDSVWNRHRLRNAKDFIWPPPREVKKNRTFILSLIYLLFYTIFSAFWVCGFQQKMPTTITVASVFSRRFSSESARLLQWLVFFRF